MLKGLNIRVILDIDDTLIEKGESLDDLADFVNEVKEMRVDTVLATARPLASIISQSWVSCIDYIIPYNGVCTYSVEQRSIENLKSIQTADIGVINEFNKVVLMPSEKVYCISAEQCQFMGLSDPLRRCANVGVSKIPRSASLLTVCGTSSFISELKKEPELHPNSVKATLYNYPETRFSQSLEWLEIVPSESSKANQLKFLDKKKKMVTIGAGNGWNDLEFLSMCSFSFCPSNASMEIRERCDKVLSMPAGKSFRSLLLDEIIRAVE